jgi:hypothetical protein
VIYGHHSIDYFIYSSFYLLLLLRHVGTRIDALEAAERGRAEAEAERQALLARRRARHHRSQ